MQDSTLHHKTVPGNFCPVKAVARRFHASQLADPNNPAAMLCLVTLHTHVLSKHVSQVLQQAAIHTTIWMKGFTLNRIGPHSICSLGAMAIYLNGITEKQIFILGQWKSQTWLTYINTQIAAISAGVS
jgi:hypothetical protein